MGFRWLQMIEKSLGAIARLSLPPPRAPLWSPQEEVSYLL